MGMFYMFKHPYKFKEQREREEAEKRKADEEKRKQEEAQALSKSLYTIKQRDNIFIELVDGTIQEHVANTKINDGFCVHCKSKLYHTNLDCDNLEWELSSDRKVRGLSIEDALKEGLSTCENCFDMDCQEDDYEDDWSDLDD